MLASRHWLIVCLEKTGLLCLICLAQQETVFIYLTKGVTATTCLIDTAGVRKRGRITEMVEKFSVVKALQAISDSHVALVVVDASEGLVDQDLHMLGHVIDSGRALVIVVNKWDGLEKEQKEYVKKEINRRLVFADYAEIHFISALHGTGVGDLYESIDIAFESANKKEST